MSLPRKTIRQKLLWLSASACLLLGSCTSADTAALPAPAAAVVPETSYLNDHDLIMNAEKRLNALHEAKALKPMKILMSKPPPAMTGLPYPATPPEFATEVAQDSVYDRCADSVLVMCHAFRCQRCPKLHIAPASGFVISADGLAVTNAHVIRATNSPEDSFAALTRDGRLLPVIEVLAIDDAKDLAVVRLGLKPDETLRPMPLGENIQPGGTVYCLSHPDRRFFYLSSGMVNRYFMSAERPGSAPRRRMAISADYAKGSSGGPILDSVGRICGVVSFTESIYYTGKENLQMVVKGCIPVSEVRSLFNQPPEPGK